MTDVVVETDGLVVAGSGDFPVDVWFDDRRIFSFWLRRDTVARRSRRFLAWPPVLLPYLDGETEVSLRDPDDGSTWVSATARIGTGTGRIRVEDSSGNPLGLDKAGKLMRLFGERSSAHLVPLLDATETVLAALREAGVEPFIAYGTLLGAVREQNFIGHDSDADIGYVSHHQTPVDVIIESFRLQRLLQDQGFPVVRYSGLAFKVVVRESDGRSRGLDVFGGLVTDGKLYLMGEVGHPFRTEWIWPLRTVTLADRQLPAPAVPERLLEAMYGPSWRVPDPAYKFETPPETVRRLNGWFRGTRVGLDRRYELRRERQLEVGRKPSAFVAWVRRQEPDATRFVDVGCGSGADVLWLARRGAAATGLDYMPRLYRRSASVARRRGLDARFGWLNLSELRSTLSTGAWLAREPGPCIVTARHVLDATDRTGKRNLLRLARMATRRGGRLYAEVQVRATPAAAATDVRPVRIKVLRKLVDESGGRVEHVAWLDEDDRLLDDPHEASVCRLVITWE